VIGIAHSGVLRRLIALGVLCVYLIASTGVVPNPPVIVRWLGHAWGERYPCEDGHCGCGSARACWTTCHCQTLAQKVAWARREGVRIPSYVDLSGIDLSAGIATPKCPLCAHHTESGRDEDHPMRDPGMPCFTALGCQGISVLIALSVPIPAPAVTTIVVEADDEESEGWFIPEVDSPVSRTLEAPAPPPRA